MCISLPFFYAFTGCDTTSSFFGKGKCKVFDFWMKSELKDDLVLLFIKLSQHPVDLHISELDLLQRFVLQIYGIRALPNQSHGYTRMLSFVKLPDNETRNLIPSKDALLQHARRAMYQAGYVWREAVADDPLPNPEQWGWKKDGSKFIPLWVSAGSPERELSHLITICSCRTVKC